MTKKQAEAKALAIKAAVAEANRRLRIEMEEDAKPCRRPFCVNRRFHLSGSGKCIISPAPRCEGGSS